MQIDGLVIYGGLKWKNQRESGKWKFNAEIFTLLDVKMIKIWTFPADPSIERVPRLAEQVAYSRHPISFMMVVVLFQLIFLNKTNYSSCRDLSPYRPFQELHNIQMLTAHN